MAPGFSGCSAWGGGGKDRTAGRQSLRFKVPPKKRPRQYFRQEELGRKRRVPQQELGNQGFRTRPCLHLLFERLEVQAGEDTPGLMHVESQSMIFTSSRSGKPCEHGLFVVDVRRGQALIP